MNSAQERPWFGHSGDLGDIIYSLPTIRAAGGGVLYLYHQDGKTWHGMDANKARNIRSLLLAQPYIDDVIYCPSGRPPYARDHKLNTFRDFADVGRNLADMHLATHGYDSAHRDTQWIATQEPLTSKSVIFARSHRCRNRGFPWKLYWRQYKAIAGFIGTPSEHCEFSCMFGPIEYIPTTDLLGVARVIAGCDLFIGNQSCPSAIAEALKHRMILSVHPRIPNCCFERPQRANLLGPSPIFLL